MQCTQELLGESTVDCEACQLTDVLSPQVHASPGSSDLRQKLHLALEAMLSATPPSADSDAAAAVRHRILEGDAKQALALPQPGSQGAEQGSQLLPAAASQHLSEAMEAYSAAAGGTLVKAAAASGGVAEDSIAAGEAALRLALLCNHLLRVCLAICHTSWLQVMSRVRFRLALCIITAMHRMLCSWLDKGMGVTRAAIMAGTADMYVE